MNKKTRFDLEESITECWKVTDDIQIVTEGLLDYGFTVDQASNALIGIQEIYELRFSKLFAIYESLVKSEVITSPKFKEMDRIDKYLDEGL